MRLLRGLEGSAVFRNLSQLIAAQQDEGWSMRVEADPNDLSSRPVDQLRDTASTGQHTVLGPQLYLHDTRISTLCPALLERVRPPRYFPVDQLRQLAGADFDKDDCRAYEYRSVHPSLFLGPAHSASGLHRDSKGTRFWMASFRLTDKVDSILLKQRGPTRCDEETIALHEKHRRTAKPNLFAEVTVWEGSVGAGELIFIPESWAHEVRNEDATGSIEDLDEEEYGKFDWLREQINVIAFAHEEQSFPSHGRAGPAELSTVDWETFLEWNRPGVRKTVKQYWEARKRWSNGGAARARES
ncbi:hypothetical protein EMIHUDRAFT_457316 [Emiliania huxleyi CCMP1516]|uniref:JmjC domain-containing protein n=2 Tax=Emiliania huxleyi TaxID=2903 RepID=A0A0D3JTB4_EMIH1|nr:hypothetical protein EMIHUDRAFT_457316 [Emiliania huxleyi CCMP1516]EOD26749.1 hypothetical protein EMIHUDRAFT_457316 [Emiliania huxleyi CCMP1516]|eukprot:XP_005779178.1 hypothetical protein EMIHUDRAFT_457316 [Emiliania huxleyi CCMP1516]